MLVFVISAVVSTGVAVAATIATTAASLVLHGAVATVRLGYRLVRPAAAPAAAPPAAAPPAAAAPSITAELKAKPAPEELD